MFGVMAFVEGMEISLIGLTTLFLIQPEWLMGKVSPVIRRVLFGFGSGLLVLTFLWSVVLGNAMSLHGWAIRL
jgi:hypothetical protein